MLEGKEIEGKIGDVGSYSVDIGEDAMIDASAEVVHKVQWFEGGIQIRAKVDLVEGLREIAKATKSEFFVNMVDGLAGFLGRAKAPAAPQA